MADPVYERQYLIDSAKAVFGVESYVMEGALYDAPSPLTVAAAGARLATFLGHSVAPIGVPDPVDARQSMRSSGAFTEGEVAKWSEQSQSFVRGTATTGGGAPTGGSVVSYSGSLPTDAPAGTVLVKADGTGLAFVPGAFGGQVIQSTVAPTAQNAQANSIYLVGPDPANPSAIYLVPAA